MIKILIDTNVLIYSIDEDSKYFTKSREIFDNPKYEIFTTSKNISEFLAVVTRLPKSALSLDEALLLVKDFNDIVTILYPTSKSNLIFLNLLEKYKPVGLKIHDYEIVSISLANRINKIATFNKKDFDKIPELSLIPLL